MLFTNLNQMQNQQQSSDSVNTIDLKRDKITDQVDKLLILGSQIKSNAQVSSSINVKDSHVLGSNDPISNSSTNFQVYFDNELATRFEDRFTNKEED